MYHCRCINSWWSTKVKMEFEQIQEQFANSLISLGATSEEAVKLTTTFFVAWKESQTEVLDERVYLEAVNEFLIRFKGKI